jgi:hypothetical protein
MTSYSTDDRYTARLKSSFANGSYIGTASIVDFIKDLKGITVDRELPALSNNSDFVWKGNSYEAELVCNDIQNLLSFAAPGLYIENGTSISAKVSPKGELAATMQSNRLAVRQNYLKDIFMSLDNDNGVIRGEMSCEEISVASMTLKDNILQLYAHNNKIGAGYSFDNHTDNETKGEFVVNGQISSEEGSPIYELSIRPSSLKYNSKEWSIQPSTIVIDGKDINVDSFGAISGEEFVSLHGRASENDHDVLTLQLERFDLSAINSLLPSDYGVRGAVTGSATLSSPMSDMNLDINLLCDSTYIANMPLGVITLGSEWNEDDRKFDFFALNEMKSKNNLDISGYFRPKDRILKADIGLDRLQVGYAQPLLKDIFSEMNGYISGTLTAFGPIDQMKIGSKDTRLDDTWLKIAYTGVPYNAEGRFHMDENGVYFDNINIKDRYDGRGLLTGSINYEYFKNITFDTRIAVNRIEGIALGEMTIHLSTAAYMEREIST